MRTAPTLLPLALLAGLGLPAGLTGCLPLAPRTEAPSIYAIGPIHREVSTASPEAQLWFDRGLGLSYGFNHEEGVRCFERAAEADPSCAMAYWGQAWALGTNYNNPVMSEEASRAAFEAVSRARELAGGASPVERDLIGALAARYAWPAPADRTPLENAYAEAMRGVRAAHPDDPDVAALAAEALMQLAPWQLWSHDGVPAPVTAEIREVLEAGLARWPDHPALCHLYIHTLEASPEVAKALPAARRLEGRTPGLGHLLHMPSHIYVWTGHYDDVVRVNLDAVAADDEFVAHAGRDNLYTLYRVHNYHFIAYGSMFEGRRELALAQARRLTAEIPPAMLTEMPDFTDIFMATPYHVLVRFGMWNEILAEPAPAPELLAATAVWRYARGIALASLGRVDEAQVERDLFVRAKAAVPSSRMLFQNPVSEVLGVAENVLAGEVEYRRGHPERAFELLRQAVALDETLNYDEPWGWMEPARHALGALLVDQGRFEEALAVYQRNLERYPENGWALFGLAECYEGLGRTHEAAEARARFEIAWARADVEIPGSCFCRVRPPALAQR